jgi:hypothetical protein
MIKTLTKEDLLKSLPRWKTGKKAGLPRTKELEKLERQLLTLKFTDDDLRIIAKQINAVDEEGVALV